MPEPTGGSLAGLRVVEISTSVAGPLVGQILGDLGAEVIKVERVGSGDDTRSWAPPAWDGESIAFLHLNRNKRSVELDYKDSRGRQVLVDLIRSADVLVQNLRPGALAKVGLLLGGAAGAQPAAGLLRHDRLRAHWPEGRRAGVRPVAAGLHGHHRHDGHRRRPAGPGAAVDPRQGDRHVGGDRGVGRAAQGRTDRYGRARRRLAAGDRRDLDARQRDGRPGRQRQAEEPRLRPRRRGAVRRVSRPTTAGPSSRPATRRCGHVSAPPPVPRS